MRSVILVLCMLTIAVFAIAQEAQDTPPDTIDKFKADLDSGKQVDPGRIPKQEFQKYLKSKYGKEMDLESYGEKRFSVKGDTITMYSKGEMGTSGRYPYSSSGDVDLKSVSKIKGLEKVGIDPQTGKVTIKTLGGSAQYSGGQISSTQDGSKIKLTGDAGIAVTTPGSTDSPADKRDRFAGSGQKTDVLIDPDTGKMEFKSPGRLVNEFGKFDFKEPSKNPTFDRLYGGEVRFTDGVFNGKDARVNVQSGTSILGSATIKPISPMENTYSLDKGSVIIEPAWLVADGMSKNRVFTATQGPVDFSFPKQGGVYPGKGSDWVTSSPDSVAWGLGSKSVGFLNPVSLASHADKTATMTLSQDGNLLITRGKDEFNNELLLPSTIRPLSLYGYHTKDGNPVAEGYLWSAKGLQGPRTYDLPTQSAFARMVNKATGYVTTIPQNAYYAADGFFKNIGKDLESRPDPLQDYMNQKVKEQTDKVQILNR